MQDPTLHHDEVMKPGDETCHSSDIINMEQTKTHIRRRSMQQSDSRKNLIVETPAIHSSSKSIQRHVVSSSPEANKLVSQSAKPSRSLYKCKGETVESNCSCRSRDTSRWHQHRHHQQGHWSGEEWETEKTGSKNKKSGVCKCLAGTLADCTVVCCCPLSLLHLLALACIKLPSIIVIRTIRKVKAKLKKKRQQQEVRQDDSDRSETPFTPSLSCRESLEDIPWTSTSSFADPKMWQEYFGVDAAGFSQEWCLQCQCTFCTNNSDLRATRSGKLRCPSDEMGWNFLLAFNTVFSYNNSVGPKMWQEYFGADSAGFTQQWHLQCKWAFCTNNLGLCSTRCGKVRCASDGMGWNGMPCLLALLPWLQHWLLLQQQLMYHLTYHDCGVFSSIWQKECIKVPLGQLKLAFLLQRRVIWRNPGTDNVQMLAVRSSPLLKKVPWPSSLKME